MSSRWRQWGRRWFCGLAAALGWCLWEGEEGETKLCWMVIFSSLFPVTGALCLQCSVNEPVPPAIIPTCLNFRTLGSDFLSARMENWPVRSNKRESLKLADIALPTYWWLLGTATIYSINADQPFPSYTNSPFGPLKSTVSPISMLSRYWDIFPPSGKLGWQFL